MTTLERLEQLERTVLGQTNTIQALSVGLAGSSNLKQDLGAVQALIKKSEEQLDRVINHMNQKNSESFNYIQMLIQRSMALEQTVTSLAKTLTAITEELELQLNRQSRTNLTSDGSGIMTEVTTAAYDFGSTVLLRIRQREENSERQRIEQMLSLKVITDSDVIGESSIVILSQTYTKLSGETETVADYRVIEVPSQLTDAAVKQLFLGKKVGETIADVSKNEKGESEGTLSSTVLKIYDLVPQVTKEGEALAATEAQPEAVATEAAPAQAATTQPEAAQ